MSELLKIQNLRVRYGENTIIDNLDLVVNTGEKCCIFGKNGAGKSTLLKSIIGLNRIDAGNIVFSGKQIENLPISSRIALGIGYLKQNDSVFPRLKVSDHIKLAASLSNPLKLDQIWENIQIALPQLTNTKYKLAGQLSGGQQRQLSLAILIAQGADKLWILDEPSAGVSKQVLDMIGDFIVNYTNEHNISCLIVEQNQFFGKKISNRIFNL